MKNNVLNRFPYHPNDIELKNIFLSAGLLADNDYNVFVNPKYGAFFYNTKCKTIQEEIDSCQNMPTIMNYHCYVPEEELLDYIDMGYEFVLGPCINITENDNESLNGVYCINYNKTLDKRK